MNNDDINKGFIIEVALEDKRYNSHLGYSTTKLKATSGPTSI